MQGMLFVVSGPSGVGKTSVVNEILKRYPQVFRRVITYTTKPARHTEVHGQDYYFISDEEFMDKVHSGFFLEWSDSYIYKYGTPAFIQDDMQQGVNYILIIDRAGVQALQTLGISCVSIWLCPESVDVLEQRLVKRGTETTEKIQKRLEIARQELACEIDGSVCDYTAPVHTIEQGVQSVLDIVFSHIKKNVKDF
ncbi:guanylate kinase [bacterium]|nr:guanylate kinase [bacterium]NBX77850.1 guanylate kinase [bacterium]